MRRYKLVRLLTVFPLLINTTIVSAEDNIKIEPLNEDFLFFLANVSFNNGETTDPLDMLEIGTEELELIQINMKTIATSVKAMSQETTNSDTPNKPSAKENE